MEVKELDNELTVWAQEIGFEPGSKWIWKAPKGYRPVRMTIRHCLMAANRRRGEEEPQVEFSSLEVLEVPEGDDHSRQVKPLEGAKLPDWFLGAVRRRSELPPYTIWGFDLMALVREGEVVRAS